MVPNELKQRKQWVCWKYIEVNGRKTKIPITPNSGRKAKTNDPSTWNSYEDALEMSKYYNGIGFVFSADDPYVGIDIDHCIDEKGELQAFAASVIEEANSYTERSPSGSGIHIIGKGKLPGNVSGKRSLAIEVYQSMRFFTVTDKPYGETKEVADVQSFLNGLFEDVFTEENPEEETKKAGYSVSFEAEAASPTDYEFLEDVLFKQKDGALLRSLYEGENPRFNGNRSQNDLFFCNKVNWANGNDLAQTDRIFRSSGRMRPKWDERHYSNGDTYGQALLRKSVHMNPKKQSR